MDKLEVKSRGKYVKTVIFVSIVVLVIVVLQILSNNPQPRPNLPENGKCDKVTDWQKCFDCHGENKSYPLKKTHPINNQKCFRCHAIDGKVEM